jgi:hypothetical protein
MLRRNPKTEPAVLPILTLVASAVRMTLSEQSWQGYRFSDEAWQKEAWDFYDTNSQLHNAVEYIGSACSLVRIYVAHVDENGVRQGEVKDDEEIAALADTLFGGPAGKAEVLRALGESLSVAGECYLVGRSANPGYRDQWITVAPSELRRTGRLVRIMIGHAVWEELNPNRDIVVRVWTPHPRRHLIADSPVRALLGVLHEMRNLTLFRRSQMNSRLANAVLMPFPNTLAQPRGDGEPTIVDDIYQQIYEVSTSNLEGKGTAAQIAPIFVPMGLAELEAMKGIEPIKFESVLSEVANQLEKDLIEKLAIGINVPVEIQIGSKDMNHWGVWFAGEEFIVKSVMPLMGRIVDAITTAYLQPALKALGKDPARYTYWYDTAPLASSANQLVDTLNLYKEGIVSAETVRSAASYNESNAPVQDELNTRFLKELMLRDPTLFGASEVREEIGIQIDMAVPELNTPPPAPPRPELGIEGPKPGQKPDTRPTATENRPENDQLIASLVASPSAAVVAANAMVLRALELAGKRMLTPTHRKMFPNTDVTKFHTKVKVASLDHADALLAGAWDYADRYLEGTGVETAAMVPVLDAYVKGLLVRTIEHHPSLLTALLVEKGCNG